MRICLALLVVGLAAAPALADKKLDPDPAFLVKARSAATATVEPHYDLVSDKVPFWARFVICAGQLTAIRDEGRALPASKDELDKLIADYRSRAADLLTYRAKADPKASALDADAEIAKVRSGAMQFLPGDVTKIGVETMKKRATERLTFCQLTRDWYEVQNGQRQATAPADQQKFAKQEAEERARDKAASAPAPMPPAIKPSVVQPTTRTAAAPAQPPVPTAKVVVPDPGTTVGGLNMRDIRIGQAATGGIVVVPPLVSGDFSLRPLWSALAECSGRMALIEQRGGGSTRVQVEGYAKRAAYILWGSRGDVGGHNLAAMATPIAQERARLGPRIPATWDEYRQRTGQPPLAHWGQVCGALETYAGAEAQRVLQAKRVQAQRDHAEAMKKFNAQSSSSSGSLSGGGYSGYSGSTNSGAADANRSRIEHQQTMQHYERENRQIRQEIKAIDRKYGR